MSTHHPAFAALRTAALRAGLATSLALAAGLAQAGDLPRPLHAKPGAKRLFSSPDTTPPVLNGISVSGAPNMAKSNPFVNITLDISDDMTGFDWGVILLQSPTGEVIGQEFFEGGAPLHVVHKEQMGYPRGGAFNQTQGEGALFTHWSAPGTWTIREVDLYDVAGNVAGYTADQLAALGNTSFQVTNASYDGIPPVLVSGQILTPTVSLSKGNDHGVPLVQAKVSMTDTGTNAAAGVDYVALYYCLPPVDANGHCSDYLSTYTSLGVPSSGVHTTVTTKNIAYSWPGNGAAVLATPGVYQLSTIIFVTPDGISNASWSSPLVGGSTDFSPYFPSTTVTITP